MASVVDPAARIRIQFGRHDPDPHWIRDQIRIQEGQNDPQK
jgi:hypothetical protein